MTRMGHDMTTAAATAPLDLGQKPLPLEQCGLALSWCLAIFGAWAWLLSAGVWSGEVTARSAGFVLLAVLSVVLQIASNYSAAAARRARVLGLKGSYAWAVRLIVAGGLYNAFSVHHAWESTGLVPPLFPMTPETLLAAAPVLLLSVVLCMFEPALYWIDEAIKGEEALRRAQAEERTLERARETVEPSGSNVFSLRRAAAIGAVGAAASLMTAAPVAPIPMQYPMVDLPADRAAETTRVAEAKPAAKPRGRWSAERRERAIDMLVSGATPAEVQAATGMHRTSVLRILASVQRAEALNA